MSSAEQDSRRSDKGEQDSHCSDEGEQDSHCSDEGEQDAPEAVVPGVAPSLTVSNDKTIADGKNERSVVIRESFCFCENDKKSRYTLIPCINKLRCSFDTVCSAGPCLPRRFSVVSQV